jgi:phosphoglycolate phosphatase
LSIKYKNIYFDLDGTIIDSSAGVVNSALYALEKFDMNNYSIDILKRTLIGPPLYEGLKNLTSCTDDGILNNMIKTFREEYSTKGVFENNLFPDIKDMLEVLFTVDCKMEILTSKPEKFAKQIIKQHKLEKYFIKISGAGEIDKKSSKSFKLGLSTKENKNTSIMIGDRIEDIIAGQDNKIDTIAVTYGFDNISLLRKQKPTYCINNVMDIVDIIKGV